MTVVAVTIAAEREGYTVLQGNASNIGDDFIAEMALPTGFGDCLVLEVWVTIFQIATLNVTNMELLGGSAWVTNASSDAFLDFVDAGRFTLSGQAGQVRVSCRLTSDVPVLWGQAGELLLVYLPEVDVNAAPTADIRINVRVKKLRTAES